MSGYTNQVLGPEAAEALALHQVREDYAHGRITVEELEELTMVALTAPWEIVSPPPELESWARRGAPDDGLDRIAVERCWG